MSSNRYYHIPLFLLHIINYDTFDYRQSPVLVHFNKRKHDYEATKRSFNNAIVKAREKLQAAQNEAKSANGKKDRYAASERYLVNNSNKNRIETKN